MKILYSFTFMCEGIDYNGNLSIIEQEFIHETEEQARRELVHTLNHIKKFRPKKLKLVQVKEWEPSPFRFD